MDNTNQKFTFNIENIISNFNRDRIQCCLVEGRTVNELHNLSGVPDISPKWWGDGLPSGENIHNFPYRKSILHVLAGSSSLSNAP
jgi:hypothetical protein